MNSSPLSARYLNVEQQKGIKRMSIIKKIKYWYMRRNDPIRYAREIGVTVGEGCRFQGSPGWGSEPWLISVGNHVEISSGVSLITHDGATWVFRDQEEYKGTLKFGRIRIGNKLIIVLFEKLSLNERIILLKKKLIEVINWFGLN